MTKHTVPPVVRHRLRRATVVAGATIAMTLSAGPAAHADGGIIGDVGDVVGGVTDPVLDPVVQSAPSTLPAPVQQAVEPVVQVVQPTVSHVQQTAASAAQGAQQATQPVVDAVKAAPSSAPAPAPAPSSAPAPAPAPSPAPASAPPPQTSPTSSAPESPQPAGTAGAPEAGAPAASHVVDEAGHTGVRPAAGASRGARHEQRRPSQAAHRSDSSDVAPRAVAAGSVVPADFGRSEGLSAEQALWNLTNALMHMWAHDGTPGSVAAGLTGDQSIIARALGTTGLTPLLLGLLLACLLLAIARRELAGRSTVEGA